MTRVKICGIMNSDELAVALQAGADAVGFVVEIEDSRHCISAEEAADLIRRVPVYTKSVAVIHPRDVDDALQLAELTGVPRDRIVVAVPQRPARPGDRRALA